MEHLTPFIVIEGLDGAGKSTLAARLAQVMGAAQLDSSNGPLKEIRSFCDTLHGPCGLARQLYYAYSCALVSDQVASLQARGQAVVLDRYWASTRTYAQVADQNAPALDEIAAQLIPATLTVFLKLSADQRCERLHRRSPSPCDADLRSLKTHDALEARFNALLATLPTTGRLLVLDATLPTDAQVELILRALNTHASILMPTFAAPQGA
jgi:dTMP kinase